MRPFVRDYLTPISVAFLAGVVAYDHLKTSLPPGPPTIVDGEKMGRAYAPTLASALSEGWTAAAEAVESGRSVAEAQDAMQAAFKAARVRSFSATVAPAFARVLPEGSEPKDDVQRAEVARLWRDFATGLKKGGR